MPGEVSLGYATGWLATPETGIALQQTPVAIRPPEIASYIKGSAIQMA